jgi:hypothetical protein
MAAHRGSDRRRDDLARADFVNASARIFHGRFLRSGKFFEQNSANSRNTKKLAFCSFPYDGDSVQRSENKRKNSLLN